MEEGGEACKELRINKERQGLMEEQGVGLKRKRLRTDEVDGKGRREGTWMMMDDFG